ncbi:TauD/TfdA family dioxygenase [Actinoplanes philippinensis]|uniref:TauD/TfdA family dioxygenase n=1 Tax=Actinoplanes philippinensis TaxID=35752 RepID=UPI0033E6C472
MDDMAGISVRHIPGADLGEAAESEAEWIHESLATTGAVLLRGSRATGTAEFQRALRAVDFAPLQYTERSTPRREVEEGVFTSTEYPAREVIPQHNESSYAAEWPGRLAFHCVTPAQTGGATPIADVSAVLRDVPARIRAAVEKRGLRYVRNYGSGVGLDWRAAFQAEDRAAGGG